LIFIAIDFGGIIPLSDLVYSHSSAQRRKTSEFLKKNVEKKFFFSSVLKKFSSVSEKFSSVFAVKLRQDKN
jgi:hypothetical protein